MTWTVTDRGSVISALGSGDIIVPSFTPAANSLLLLAAVRTNENTVTSISGHGTWSNITTVDDIAGVGTNRDLEIWGCRVGGSPSASAVTLSRGYLSQCEVQITDLSETAGIFGTAVADAHGTGSSDTGYNQTTFDVTLGAFANSTNLTYVVCMSNQTYSGSAWTPSAGHTELLEWDSASTSFSSAIHYLASEDTTPSVGIVTPFVGGGIWAVEVKHAAASTASDVNLHGTGRGIGRGILRKVG